jgi:hypothetical protein
MNKREFITLIGGAAQRRTPGYCGQASPTRFAGADCRC